MNLRRNFRYKNYYIINYINTDTKTKNLILRWRNNPSIRCWMYTDHIISDKEHYNFLKNLKTDEKNYAWIIKNNNNQYIGVISINRYDAKNKNAYLGIYANPEEKILGAGSQLMDCLKYIAFNIAKLHTLKLEVLANNNNAIKFYKKQGFKKEGVLKEFIIKNNKFIDVLILGTFNNKK